MVDRRDRNRVEIDARRPAPDAAVEVDQRALVTALAVDEHQHLVRSEAAQRGRPDRVGAVGDRRAREVERRRQRLDHLGRLGVAGGGDLLVGDHVHRHRFLGRGAGGARPDRHLLGEPEAEGYVQRDGRAVHHHVRDLRRQPERFDLHLYPATAYQRSRHRQRVVAGGVGGHGVGAADYRDACARHREPVDRVVTVPDTVMMSCAAPRGVAISRRRAAQPRRRTTRPMCPPDMRAPAL